MEEKRTDIVSPGLFVPRKGLEEETKAELERFQRRKARKARNSRFGEPVYIVCENCGKGPNHGGYSLRKTKKGMVCQNC